MKVCWVSSSEVRVCCEERDRRRRRMKKKEMKEGKREKPAIGELGRDRRKRSVGLEVLIE